MRSNQPIFASLRVMLAVIFGLMSLGHEPVMTFAHAHSGVATDHSAISEHKHGHNHDLSSAVQKAPLTAPAMCYSSGCFMTVKPTDLGIPATSQIPLEKLAPAAAQVLVATAVEPADPPPRLSV